MPTQFSIPLNRFDTNLLPADARQVGTDAFKTAVILHFAQEYGAQGQTVLVTVDEDEITVRAFPAEASALDFVMPMLRSGRLDDALPYLESLTRSAPANADVLFNLGIVYSELGRYDEAVIRLKRAVELNPAHAHAWVAIGTAYHRMRRAELALDAYQKAVEIDPKDGYTRRNLGGVLIMFDRVDEAVTHLRAALALMPDDPHTIFGLATALEKLDSPESELEADGLYARFVREHPNASMVGQAEKSRSAYAAKRLRSAVPAGLRLDVVQYITRAIQTFEKIGAQGRQAVVAEIATLGSRGLDINDPGKRYSLASLPGDFSGLQLVAMMYTGLRQMDPSLDAGIDFSAEFEIASRGADART